MSCVWVWHLRNRGEWTESPGLSGPLLKLTQSTDFYSPWGIGEPWKALEPQRPPGLMQFPGAELLLSCRLESAWKWRGWHTAVGKPTLCSELLFCSYHGVGGCNCVPPKSPGNLMELVQISPGSPLHSSGKKRVGPVCGHRAPRGSRPTLEVLKQ